MVKKLFQKLEEILLRCFHRQIWCHHPIGRENREKGMIYTGFGYFDIGGYRVAGGDSDSSSGPTWPMPKLSFLKGTDFSKFK